MWDKFWDNKCVIRKMDGRPAVMMSMLFDLTLISFALLPAVLAFGLVVAL